MSTWTLKIGVTNSVCRQMWNTVMISPSVLNQSGYLCQIWKEFPEGASWDMRAWEWDGRTPWKHNSSNHGNSEPEILKGVDWKVWYKWQPVQTLWVASHHYLSFYFYSKIRCQSLYFQWYLSSTRQMLCINTWHSWDIEDGLLNTNMSNKGVGDFSIFQKVLQ